MFKILHKLCLTRSQGGRRQTRRPRCNAGTVEQYVHGTQRSHSLSGALHTGRAGGVPPGPAGLGRSGKGPPAPFLALPSLSLLETIPTAPGDQLRVCSYTSNSLPSWFTQQRGGGWPAWTGLHAIQRWHICPRSFHMPGMPRVTNHGIPSGSAVYTLAWNASEYPKKYCEAIPQQHPASARMPKLLSTAAEAEESEGRLAALCLWCYCKSLLVLMHRLVENKPVLKFVSQQCWGGQ